MNKPRLWKVVGVGCGLVFALTRGLSCEDPHKGKIRVVECERTKFKGVREIPVRPHIVGEDLVSAGTGPVPITAPDFVERFKDSDIAVRVVVVQVLGESCDPVAVPPLIKFLRDRDGKVRENAARALGQIGPAAKVSVPALTEALKDENAEVCAEAAEALKKIQAE